MKKVILFLSVLCFSLSSLATQDTALRRSNGLLRFIAQQHGMRDFALGSVIGTRCNRYMVLSEKSRCKAAVKKMIEILDYDIIFSENKNKIRRDQDANEWTPSAFVFVAFKQNLISLLNSPDTSTYLYDLNQDLYRYLVGEKSELNIWDVTKSYYRTDYMTALVIATLFQDTSIMKLHLAYLDRAETSGTASFQSNKELLSRVIDTINLILDSSEQEYRSLFYPKEIQKDLNRNIYHFYVPLFLAKALEVHGFSKETSSEAALMLTLSYEFVTSSKDYRYLYTDPATITDKSKIKDIFGGYCGGNIGVRGMNFFKSFEAIRAAFERSTEDGVHLLLRH